MDRLLETVRKATNADRRRELVSYFHTLKQYAVLNECLQLIDKSKISTVKKLTIESHLIRMKTLLLDRGAPGPVEGGEDRFSRLLRQVQRVSENGCDNATVDEFLEKVQGMLTALDENRRVTTRGH
jgi:hypothetical protein